MDVGVYTCVCVDGWVRCGWMDVGCMGVCVDGWVRWMDGWM